MVLVVNYVTATNPTIQRQGFGFDLTQRTWYLLNHF